MKVGAGRIGALDGLRGLSILLVMAGHSLGSGRLPEWLGIWAAWLPGAQTGVRIFFVISGFIITHLLLREEQRFGRIRLGKFWIRRVFRLFPALVVYVAGVGLFVRWEGIPDFGWKEFVAALTFTTGIWEGGTWLLGHTWSLAVEQQFYLVWPVVLVLCSGVGRVWFCALLGALGPVARSACYWGLTPGEVPPWFPCEMDCLMWGCGCALLMPRGASKILPTGERKAAGLVLAAALLVWLPGLMVCRPSTAMFSVPLGGTCQGAGAAVLIMIGISGRGTLGAILSWSPLRAVGIVSYSLYLWQQPFLQGYHSSIALPFPLDWALAFAFATTSYWWVERAFLNLKDRRFGALAPASCAAAMPHASQFDRGRNSSPVE